MKLDFSYFMLGTYASDRHGVTLPVEDLSDEQKKLAFTYAIETRRFEIERFWQRSLFFWGFVAASFVAYSAQKEDFSRFIVTCFGLLVSVAWTTQNRGAKYWQEAWEQKVRVLERDVLGTMLFTNKEKVEAKGWFGASRFSVSKITIILSDFTVLAWALLLSQWAATSCRAVTLSYTIAGMVTMAGVGLILVSGRSTKKPLSLEPDRRWP